MPEGAGHGEEVAGPGEGHGGVAGAELVKGRLDAPSLNERLTFRCSTPAE